jgi:hypothetical protein
MWGYEDVTLLSDQDQADINSFIAAAYLECYVPTDGSKPNWPEKYETGILKAPVVTTLGLTNGSKVVTGYAFEDDYAGSFVKIGDKFFRYGKKVVAGMVTTYYLVQPWDGATGSFDATVYHNAIELPWHVVQLAGVPNIIGLGALAPLPDADAELNLRIEPAFDFESKGARRPFTVERNTFRQSAYYDIGDPRYYHIDQASVGFTFGLGNRFHVYPLPERIMTFEVRANVVPDALVDADTPAMPARTVDTILLPLARENLALNTTGRRFTGNASLIIRAADKARAMLKGLRRVQKDVAGSVRLRRGW